MILPRPLCKRSHLLFKGILMRNKLSPNVGLCLVSGSIPQFEVEIYFRR